MMIFTLLVALQLVDPAASTPAAELEALRQSLGESSNSPTEVILALEGHLKRYPKSQRLEEIERAIAKAALQVNDTRRVLKYGQLVLERERNDPKLLDAVAVALLGQGGKQSTEQAARYAEQLLDAVVIAAQESESGPPRERARMHLRTLESLARARYLRARALSQLGEKAKALELVRLSVTQDPEAGPARLAGDLLLAAGDAQGAAEFYASAYILGDDRPGDRKRIEQAMAKSGKPDVGAAILGAYERLDAFAAARKAELRKIDPNHGVENPLEYTITGVSGETLQLKSLKGKVVILDFWATWCGPCRVQQPLYEKVKERFKQNDRVMFLALSTDEDRAAVAPFLEANKWSKNVWFDDGLGDLLQVGSIPTTVVFTPSGAILSRMNGFVPERFVDMLSERILMALND
jgi:thiol-disulfide isomerase/thioredoxin/plasmid stabilization system protein ParE